MSGLLGNALPNFILREPDKKHADACFSGRAFNAIPALLWLNAHDAGEPASYRTPWWPASSCLFGGLDGVDENTILAGDGYFCPPWIASGANGRLGFVGYTRDQYGSAIGDVTVRCFRTSTNELVSQVTSDANGFYIATTPYSDGHYLVVHKTSSIAGATIDTLTPG